MMTRKKKIAIIITSVLLVVLIIIGVLLYLFLNTDTFKSNQELFAKYFIQNFEVLDIFKNTDTLGIEENLNNSKYTSNIEGNIQYTENLGTSDENNNSKINDVGIKVASNIDKINNYDYKDISIGTAEDDLIRFEYLKQDDTIGIRLNGIKQFVSSQNTSENSVDVEKINNIFTKLKSIITFSENEKQTLRDNYIKIIKEKIPKDRYFKEADSTVIINNQNVLAKSYCVKLTIEEYNDIYMEILKQITNDEIILSKIDILEDIIKEDISNYEFEKTLRESFVDNIDKKIEEIANNNIGNEEILITVFVSNTRTVRTEIQKTTHKITLDLYDNSYIKISDTETTGNINEEFIKIQKENTENKSVITTEYEKIEDNEITDDIQLKYERTFEDSNITKKIELELLNEKYKAIFNISNDIKIVDDFEDQITLESDNIKLDELEEEKVNRIKETLSQNIQNQINNLLSVVKIEDYKNMLSNLKVIKQNSVEVPDDYEVTDLERKRYNSQFEFFKSENLTKDNINELLNVVKNNFEDMRVLTKSGAIEELDIEKINAKNENYQEYKKYIENISEILISIKENSTNEKRLEEVNEFVENYQAKSYTVDLEYNDDGLVRIIRIKPQER